MQKTYTIEGNPIALSRPRLSHKRVYDSQANIKSIASLIVSKQHGSDPLFDGPVHLDVTFYMHIPHSSRHKPVQGNYHVFTPDLSNLLKFYEDICSGVCFKDDAIISSISCRKLYDKNPRTLFTLSNL